MKPTLRAEMHKKKIMKMADIILDKYDKKEAWNRVALVAVISVEIEDLLAQVEAKARLNLLNEVRDSLYMYTHQWVGDDKKRVCESCGEVVERWTVCEASQLKANDLVDDLLQAIEKLKEKHE